MAKKRAAHGRPQQLSYVPEEVSSAVLALKRKLELPSMAAAYRNMLSFYCTSKGINRARLIASGRRAKKGSKNAR